jgi:ribosome modulation factor
MIPRLLFCLLLPVLLSQCTAARQRQDQSLEAQKQQQFEQKQADRAAYEQGIADGRADAEAGLIPDASRHSGASPYATAHAQGYTVGLAAVERESTMKQSPEKRAAHDAGFEAGLSDKIHGRERDPDRHSDKYDPAQKEAFLDGYDTGYKSE